MIGKWRLCVWFPRFSGGGRAEIGCLSALTHVHVGLLPECSVAYLHLVANPNDFISFERIANVPKRGVGDASLAKIINEAVELKQSPLQRVMTGARIAGVNNNAWDSLVELCKLLTDCRLVTKPQSCLCFCQRNNPHRR